MNRFCTNFLALCVCAWILPALSVVAEQAEGANPLRSHDARKSGAQQSQNDREELTPLGKAHVQEGQRTTDIPPEVWAAMFPEKRDGEPSHGPVINGHDLRGDDDAAIAQVGFFESAEAKLEPRFEFHNRLVLPEVDYVRQAVPRIVTSHVDSRSSHDSQQAHLLDSNYVNSEAWEVVEYEQEAPSVVVPQQTLAELLAESNRQGRSERTSPTYDSGKEWPADNDDSDKRGLGQIENGHENFAETLQRIAVSLCLVLFIGVSFILVAKKWFAATGSISAGIPTKKRPKRLENHDVQIRVLTSLRLNSKSTLFVVEAGEQKVMVANDQTGIRAVVPLTSPFAAALDEMDTLESTEDDQETAIATNVAGTYSRSASTGGSMPESAQPVDTRHSLNREETNEVEKSKDDIEAEMRRQLMALLGGSQKEIELSKLKSLFNST
ncbi:MAG TPA: hypothetical protein PKD64_01800 [Pirellulaceae bacterium]|nr:hypothetical protein [Pirellulaceae bacterium]HMO90904.1 hypothetical protein [Pirellulaceae bacterium]HMP68620.1 hypothetical protein [Pirellulaceae bacterium]